MVSVGVDGGGNHPGDDADGEVMLDIEVAGAVAPGAHIAVYFAPNTDQGFYDAITNGDPRPTRKPSVVSISWGGPEVAWTQQAMHAFDPAFQDAAALGVTVCAAAGDNGSSDMRPVPGRRQAARRLPGLQPVRAGLRRHAARGGGRQDHREVVWNEGRQDGATGGGVSQVSTSRRGRRRQRARAGSPSGSRGRGVPDVAGDADPLTGYEVRIDGRDGVIGGTSAVAPLWAGLVALLNEKLGKPVGYLNPVLYGLPEGVFRDIDQGDNDVSRQGSRTRPARAGTPAPGSAARTAPPCWRRCRQGRRRCERGRGGSGRGRPLPAFPLGRGPGPGCGLVASARR